jgi:gliding motility-associated protein GldM
MGHGKETPRQKMIGMMYLVLTALLAMNISKSVLDAFILVDEGLTKTTHNFFQKNINLYDDFDKAYQLNQTKVADWKSKADEVRTRSQALYDLMQEDKKLIILAGEGKSTKAITANEILLKEVKVKDNSNTPSQIMIFEKRGDELKEKIIKYREYLISLIVDTSASASLVASLESSLYTKDPPPDIKKGKEPRSWSSEHFQNLPLAAVITMLSKMQSDIRNAESEIITYLLSQVDVGDIKFNKIEAVVIANSDYIFKGSEYKAQVFLAAYDSTKDPEVQLDNGTKLPIENGKGIYKVVGSVVGTRTWAGTILLDQGSGTITRRDFKKEYQVAEASAVISPTKMNVFYRGVANPVSISVPGVSKESLLTELTKGSIKRGGTDWEVWPADGPEGEIVTVKVYATVEKAKQFMGQMDFRVKNVPSPVAQVFGKSTGTLSVNQLVKAGGVKAVMKDFDFQLEFNITEFWVSATFSGGYEENEKSDGPNFSKKQLDIISKLTSGKRVTIENIKAVGPSGDVRQLNTINFKIN